RPELGPMLKAESGSAMGGVGRSVAFGSWIVITQIALAMPILAAAGLVTRTLANLRAEDAGFNPQHLLVFQIDSTYSRKNLDTVYRDLQQQLRSLPGVVSVSRSGVALLSNGGRAAPIFSHDQPALQVRAHGLPMSSDFLTTMGIPLRQGRMFGDEDSERARSKDVPTQVVVNETLVRQLFGFRDPLGKYFHFGNASGPAYEIIGVVGNAKYDNVRDTIRPTVYMPIGDWNGPMYFEVRTGMESVAVIPEIQSAVRRFDSNLLIVGMKTETEQIDEDLYQERLMSVLSGLFAALAVVRPGDPLTFVVTAVLLVGVALIGSYIPHVAQPRSIPWWRCGTSEETQGTGNNGLRHFQTPILRVFPSTALSLGKFRRSGPPCRHCTSLNDPSPAQLVDDANLK